MVNETRSKIEKFEDLIAWQKARGSTAKASCAELRSQLYVALDVGYIDSPTFHDLRTQSEEVGRIVGGLRVSIARQRLKQSSKHRG